MQENSKTLGGILHDILSVNRRLLLDRSGLMEKLDAQVPSELQRDYAALRRALGSNVGEMFFSADGADAVAQKAAKEKAAAALVGTGMQEARAQFVVRTIAEALEWSDAPAEEALMPDAEKSEGTDSEPLPRVNLMKEQADGRAGVAEDKVLSSLEAVAAPPPEAVPSTASVQVDGWMCSCGKRNAGGNFCGNCGKPRIVQAIAEPVIETPMEMAAVSDLSQAPSPVPAPSMRANVPVSVAPQVSADASSSAAPPDDTEHSKGWMDRIREYTMENIFITKGRLNRLAYWKHSIIWAALVFVPAFVAGLISAVIAPLGGLLLLIVGAIACIGGVMLEIRRCHDLDKSGWLVLLLFIPYLGILFGIYLLFFKGTDGDNRYGPDPLQGT